MRGPDDIEALQVLEFFSGTFEELKLLVTGPANVSCHRQLEAQAATV